MVGSRASAARSLRKMMAERTDLDDRGLLELLNDKAEGLEQKKRAAMLQAGVAADRVERALDHPMGPAHGANAWLTRDVTGQAGYVPAEKLYRAILGRWHSKWAEALSAMRTRSLGFSLDVATVKAVVSEQRL